jgi:EAL domain-containing protein (putative c-di-GMP-specific phosphodiesterase class I)
MSNAPRTLQVLGELRVLGIRLSIDDVGTGYSSLQTITEVEPDFIKIDLSLIKNIHRSLIKQELVHSLLHVAARIGARVIAEGIETEDEYRTLRRCGVRYGQGFWFARPAPPFPGLTPRER